GRNEMGDTFPLGLDLANSPCRGQANPLVLLFQCLKKTPDGRFCIGLHETEKLNGMTAPGPGFPLEELEENRERGPLALQGDLNHGRASSSIPWVPFHEEGQGLDRAKVSQLFRCGPSFLGVPSFQLVNLPLFEKQIPRGKGKQTEDPQPESGAEAGNPS